MLPPILASHISLLEGKKNIIQEYKKIKIIKSKALRCPSYYIISLFL